MEKISEKLITCIRELLETKKMSMYRLAQNAGISQSTLSNIIHRNNAPGIDTLERICKGLGMTMSEFFVYMEYIYDHDQTSEAGSIMEMYLALSPESRRYIMTSLQYVMNMERR